MRKGEIKLEEYFRSHPLDIDLVALSDKALCHDRDRKKVNELILNIIIKYLANYTGTKERYAEKVRSSINRTIQIAKAADENPDSYQAQLYCEMNNGMQGSDYYPLMCAADIRATAAMFKEVAFNDRFKKEDRFIGLDLGSGTGISTLAMAVAARRQGIEDITCVGIDHNPIAWAKSSGHLKRILGDQVEMICGDVTNRRLFDEIVRGSGLLRDAKWSKGKRIDYWVSETIATGTPPVKGDRYAGSTDNSEIMWRDYVVRQQEEVDLYYDVYWLTKRGLKNFGRHVKNGRTAMFPDPINDKYNPNFEKSTLKLQTGLNPSQPLLLEHIGQEFDMYEDLKNGCCRWKPSNGQMDLFRNTFIDVYNKI